MNKIKIMNKIELTAPCGLDCFNCGWFEENLTDEIRVKEAERLGISFDEVNCKGCRIEQGKCWWAKGDCATWDCVQKKGLTFCHECTDFPCKLLMPTQQGAAFPHNMKVYNLCRMRLLGMDKWIEESSEIRKCYYEGKFEVGKGPRLENENK
jgi:hypothetical protein